MKIVAKPWGREKWWAVTPRYVAKILEVKAGHALSLQYHKVKLETMLFFEGYGTLTVGDRSIPILPGLVQTIEPGTPHRIEAETDLVIFEVSTPEVDDVVRISDDYGRADVT